MPTPLDWLPSLVGGLLAFLGFCLVWYRMRCLERQVGSLEDLSYRDHQTGLRSGRLFDDDAALLCRSSSGVAVVVIDLDDFGRFNRIGYREGGDRALLTAANVLRANLKRAADRIYRLHTAGDEFVLLFTVESFADAYQQAERLRRALERAGVLGSVGIHYADAMARRNPSGLLAMACSGKDQAKKRGGNAVFPPTEAPTACADCGRWIDLLSLDLYARRDDDDKQSYCAGCGAWAGVEGLHDDDSPPPPVPVAIAAEHARPHRLPDLPSEAA